MVVFAGLVGYPPLSGSVDPGFLVKIRNSYLERMSRAITEPRGTRLHPDR